MGKSVVKSEAENDIEDEIGGLAWVIGVFASMRNLVGVSGIVAAISPYFEDDMLGIEPLELNFHFELNKKILCSIELTNETNSYIAFIIQTTSHLPYCTQPGKGIVQPQSRRSVNITLQPLDRAPPLDKERTRNFIVRSTKVNEILIDEDINEDIFNIEEGKLVDEVTLTVIYKADVSKVDLNIPYESDVPPAKAGSTVVDFPSMEGKKQCTMSDDEEPAITSPIISGTSSRPTEPGRVQLVIKRNKTAPLAENEQTVMLELTGGDCTSDRPGLDLVLVMDVSTCQQELKTAMRFVVRKLGPIDRLSVVGCATTKLFPLRESTREELVEVIDERIEASDWGNSIEDGLVAGLKVLADRTARAGAGRVAAIVLVCENAQNQGNACKVSVGDVPVYTFGYGTGKHAVLSAVAANSLGGTFSHISEGVDESRGGLTMALSQCVAGLLTVSVQDLELTLLAPVGDESSMVKTSAGSYPQIQLKGGHGSVTVRFGNLYSGEVRKVIVDLRFAARNTDHNLEFLNVTYSYSSSSSSSSSGGREWFVIRPLTVWRTTYRVEEDKQWLKELDAEKAHLQVVDRIQYAAGVANASLAAARGSIERAQKLVMPEDPLLRTELRDLAQPFYTIQGRNNHGYAYLHSLLSSHNRQRSTARGKHVKILRSYATPSMLLYLDEAMQFWTIATQDTTHKPETKTRGLRIWPWHRRS